MAANLLTGMVNYISLAFAAFYGVGAYLTALSIILLKFSFFPTLALIVLINSTIALLIVIPTLKLKGDYFILATLGLQVIIYNIFYNWTNVTKGPYGISGITNPIFIGSITINSTLSFLGLGLILAVISAGIFYKLIYSPFGRVLRGIRDDEISLLSLGRNVAYFKTMAFIISSAFCGIAGYIYASYISYIDPSSFTLDESIFILSALLIGGTGNLKGPIFGAIFVVLIPEIFRFVGLPDSIGAPLKQVFYGSSLVLIMFFRKQGIAGAINFH